MPRSNEAVKRKHELKLWKSLYDSTRESKEALASTRSEFRKFFEAGHRTPIDGIFEDLVDDVQAGKVLNFPYEHLNDVHPRAWEIILKHGKHYRPTSWQKCKPWEWEQQPLSGSCFLNAIEMIWAVRKVEPKARAVYVEGFCIGPLVYPMLHAWNGIGFAGVGADWSFYASTMFNRYFGIPFTFEEYQYINKNEEDFSVRLMFRRDNFETIEERLLDVLRKPRTRLMRAK